MKTSSVAELLQSDITLQEVILKGWVRTFRSNRFIALNDGSTIHNIQCVVDFENTKEETLKRITTGASVCIIGTLVESQGKGRAETEKLNEHKVVHQHCADQNHQELTHSLSLPLPIWAEVFVKKVHKNRGLYRVCIVQQAIPCAHL